MWSSAHCWRVAGRHGEPVGSPGSGSARGGCGPRCAAASRRDLRLGRGVRVRIAARTSNTLSVGQGCKVGDGVRIELDDGELVLGERVDVRHGCVLGARGRLVLEGPNLVQHGCTLHCDDSVTLSDHAVLGELVTVVDSSHRHGGSSGWFLHDVATAPVRVGSHVWVAAKATIGRGVHLGDGAVVGANSVVVRDVPAGRLASGVPAVVVERAHHDAEAPVGTPIPGSEPARPASSS